MWSKARRREGEREREVGMGAGGGTPVATQQQKLTSPHPPRDNTSTSLCPVTTKNKSAPRRKHTSLFPTPFYRAPGLPSVPCFLALEHSRLCLLLPLPSLHPQLSLPRLLILPKHVPTTRWR